MAELSVQEFVSILHKCRREKSLSYAKYIHACICNNGLEAHRVVGNYVVPMFVECGSVPHAHQVFTRLAHRNDHSWASLILGYIQNGHSQYAFHMYKNMLEDCVPPSRFTLMALLKACARMKEVEKGRQIHVQIRKYGFEDDLFVGNTIVDMYAKCGSLSEAVEVFDKLLNRDVVSWNVLIDGYVEHGSCHDALKFFDQMLLEGVFPDAVTFISILKACGSAGFVDKGKEIHMKIIGSNFETELIVGNALVNMYVKYGSLTEACKVFDKLLVKDVVTWSALISGYAEHGPGEDALKCFEEMKQVGISPDTVTFVCVLKACGSMGAVEKGREIHMELIQKGFEKDIFVGNTLIDMYAKCGSLSEALRVFEKLPVRDVVSWNTVITGYTDLGDGQEALKYFEDMHLQDISPNAMTYCSILKACGSIGSIEMGRKINMEIIQRGFHDLYVGNALIDMYVKCGSLSEARNVFEKLPVRDVVSWNTLIAGYADHGPCQEAVTCFEQMQLEDISPNAITFLCILKVCCSIKDIHRGREVHMEIKKSGIEDPFLGNSVVNMYAKFGSLFEAQEVFDKLSVRDVVSWSALIAGYTEHGPAENALECFEQMQVEGILPDAITFVCVLKACGSTGAVERGREIHLQIAQKGFEGDLFVGNSLIDLYAKCGLLSEAWDVFDQMPVRDVVTWSTLIAGYAEQRHGQEALKQFEQMQVEGVTLDAIIFACILKVCGNIGAVVKGREIHIEIIQKGLDRDLSVGNALIDMYATCGSLLEAQEVFDKLPARNVVTWTALIAGYAEHGQGQKALKCFEQMQLEGVFRDAITYSCSLKACASIGAIAKGQEIHTEIAIRGFERDLSVCNALIDMYAKCGSLSEAQRVFDSLIVRDIVSWSAMINGYGMNHKGVMAVQCFNDMQEHGVKPNAVTFTCLLTACSRSGLIFKGQDYFKLMMEEYGIAPTIDHHTCIVDLLARSGNLYDAEKFLYSMPFCPSTETWTALLSACKAYGEAELGVRCFQQLVQMNRENAIPYVLMASIYATAGRKSDVYRIEESRKLATAKKKPASASIEVNKKIYEFVVGDSQSYEISAMLEVLSSDMEEEVFLPNLDFISRSTDEEKEAALCEHAEKLAIAFGLLNLSQGQCLHVTKNMRMCNNCHDACKIISRIEKREIIVRDSYCIHHFKGGFCSCSITF